MRREELGDRVPMPAVQHNHVKAALAAALRGSSKVVDDAAHFGNGQVSGREIGAQVKLDRSQRIKSVHCFGHLRKSVHDKWIG